MMDYCFTMTANGLQLQEVGDFEALNCQPATNLIRSTKLYLTTEPPISCRCCYRLAFLSSVSWNHCQYWVLRSLPSCIFVCRGLCGCVL